MTRNDPTLTALKNENGRRITDKEDIKETSRKFTRMDLSAGKLNTPGDYTSKSCQTVQILQHHQCLKGFEPESLTLDLKRGN